MTKHALAGAITSIGFESGDRVVIGNWRSGPIGPMLDVMHVDSSHKRTLMALDERTAAFVSAVYQFDEVLVDPALSMSTANNLASVRSSHLNIDVTLGRRVPIPFRRLRTPSVTRYVESPIARALMGVATYGTTSRGIHEWYQADGYRRVLDATGSGNDGVSFGAMRPLRPALNVGFSEPPKQPSMVDVRPLLHDPSSALDDLLRQLA